MAANWQTTNQCSSENFLGRGIDMSLRRTVVLMGYTRLGVGTRICSGEGM